MDMFCDFRMNYFSLQNVLDYEGDVEADMCMTFQVMMINMRLIIIIIIMISMNIMMIIIAMITLITMNLFIIAFSDLCW